MADDLLFESVSIGTAHSCGLSRGGEIYCWGSNGFGQLGDGRTTSRSQPTRVAEGGPFVAVSAGGYYSCAVSRTGIAYCWGRDPTAEFGSGEPPGLRSATIQTITLVTS